MEVLRASSSTASITTVQCPKHRIYLRRAVQLTACVHLWSSFPKNGPKPDANIQNQRLHKPLFPTLSHIKHIGLVRRSNLMASASPFGCGSEHLAPWLCLRPQVGGSLTAAFTLRNHLSSKWPSETSLLRERTNEDFDSGRSSMWRVGRRSLLDRGQRQQQVWPAKSLPVAAVVELVASSSAAAATISGPHIVTTVTQVAVTAAAVVYGAYLSDEMLRGNKDPEKPRPLIFEGIDVTDYPIFKEPEVQKAIAFAADAHAGQMRKTGEPYITHCIHTGRILAALVPSQSRRAIDTVVAGILHDVVDDAGRKLSDVRKHFGEDVMRLVEGVSKLSHINQLLRRHRRTTAEQNSTAIGLSPEDVDSLRMMLLGMVNDPRVVLIKLADRLHNMRTIYALPHAKACAVAQETLAVWCSLASRLGVWAVKAELEDLCFAVLQPKTFRHLRAELAALWTPSSDWRQQRRMKRSKRWALQAAGYAEDFKRPKDPEDDEDITMRDLLEAVVPFDVLLDRNRRSCGLGQSSSRGGKKAKVVRDAEVALAALGVCEEALDKELLITTPYVPGMEVMLSGRLKSLYSAYCKMRRKGVGLDQVYDGRALRVVVGDGGGTLNELAVEGCYSLLNVVHSLWTPVGGEFDDYILNPKPSGYQSLHTAVTGPDGAALEVQIRTQSMHEYAEYGHAAHWLYKEGDTPDFTIQNPSPANGEREQGADQETEASTSSSDRTSFIDVIIGLGSASSDVGIPLPEALRSSGSGDSREGSGRNVQSGSQSAASTRSSHTVEESSSNQRGAVEGRELFAGPGLDSADLRTSGTFGVDDDSDGDLRLGAATAGRRAGSGGSDEADVEGLLPLLPATWPISIGQPALRIEDGRLLAAVVVRVDNNGRDLLVAVSFALHAREAVAAGRGSSQVQRWATYARLLQKVQSRWWNAPGHGDWSTCLEHYTLCKDGIYHKEDQFGRALPTFIQLLELSPQEQREYAEIGDRLELGQDLESWEALNPGRGGAGEALPEEAVPSTVARLNNKVRLLRSMLQWEQELRHEAATDGSITALDPASNGEERVDVVCLSEVLIIRWPGGDIVRMPSGSEAKDVARQVGAEGGTVLVNNRVAVANTKLRDGDLVEIRL